MGYLVDSNVLIDYVAERFSAKQLVTLDALFDSDLTISIITRIETLGFNAPEHEEKKMVQFLSLANVLQLNEQVVNATIALRKAFKIKTPDAIIAATALVNRLTLLSRNASDFKKIAGLDCIDPHSF